MKIPFFHDHKLKRDELKYKSLFEHCDGLLDHLTPKERDQFRRYLSKEFKLQKEERRKQINFRNHYKPYI
tara:strand:+ start:169 stop:378 length:210 start_codon:yes stop_codon:yes gene_type:complete